MNLAHYSKAIVAAIMAAIGMLNAFFNTGIVVDPDAVTAAVSLLTPLLVYIVPNRGQ
jgi:hypothetical protein